MEGSNVGRARLDRLDRLRRLRRRRRRGIGRVLLFYLFAFSSTEKTIGSCGVRADRTATSSDYE